MIKIALIPSYEPDLNLINIVKDLVNNKFEVIVVNDGSNNTYNNIFDSIKDISKVLSYKTNKGKGFALKYGYKYIKENYENYIIVTMDSDGQHKVSDAQKLCNYIEHNYDCIAIGKRIRSNKTPVRSRIGNSITKVIYNLVTGNNIYDTQTGLRTFSYRLIDFNLDVKGDRYEYEMNVLLEAPLNNIKIKEIEIETIYIDNNFNSHFNTLKDSFRVYKEIIKFSLSSILSFIIDYVFYTIFILIFHNITLSNISARIISATTNYTINKNLVFNNKRKVSKSLLEYFILAIVVLILNTILLNALVLFGLNVFISKILVEITLFIFSWLIQKKMIFRKDKYEEAY